MDQKTSGIDFDRQVFVTPTTEGGTPSGSPLPGILLLLVVISGLGFLGYKYMSQSIPDDPGKDRALAQIDQRMAGIEERLEQIEKNHKRTAGDPALSARNPASAAPSGGDAHSPSRFTYRVSPAPGQQQQSRGNSPSDPALNQKVVGIQQGLGNLQQDTAANREAWQATADRLADVSGQVGNQQVQMLRSQDELNQLLARTQRTAIPFEVRRGADRQPVGPVYLILKSTNPKTQRYTLCVYVQESCVEMKERNRYEVVQFVISRYTAPLEVIATSVTKDEITGYLEVPIEKPGH